MKYDQRNNAVCMQLTRGSPANEWITFKLNHFLNKLPRLKIDFIGSYKRIPCLFVANQGNGFRILMFGNDSGSHHDLLLCTFEAEFGLA